MVISAAAVQVSRTNLLAPSPYIMNLAPVDSVGIKLRLREGPVVRLDALANSCAQESSNLLIVCFMFDLFLSLSLSLPFFSLSNESFKSEKGLAGHT